MSGGDLSRFGGVRVEGLDRVMANMRKRLKSVQVGTLKQLIVLGLRIQRESQNLTPVFIGNLKASAYTAWGDGTSNLSPTFLLTKAGGTLQGKENENAEMLSDHQEVINTHNEALRARIADSVPSVEVGHTASYALFVHENEEVHHEVGCAKFLERAANIVSNDIVPTLKRAKMA